MKIKIFLRGLGIGILVTTLVLCVSYRKKNSDSSIVERARELGMEFPEKTPEALLQPSASPNVAVSGAAADRMTEQPKEAPSSEPEASVTQPPQSATAVPTVKPTAKPTAKPTVKPTAKPKKTADKNTRTFTVRGGLLSSSVAREMKAAGVIEDDDALDDYLEKNGLARKVRAGTYKIPVGASYEEIAKIITRQD